MLRASKMEMWLEHLWWGDTEEAVPVKQEKAERRPYQCTQIPKDDGARQFPVVPSHRIRSTKGNTGCSTRIWGKASLRVTETGAGCPEIVEPLLTRCSKPTCVTCSGVTLPGQGAGPDALQRPLPTPAIPWCSFSATQAHWYENIKKRHCRWPLRTSCRISFASQQHLQ